MDQEERELARLAHQAAYRRDAKPVLAALAAAGIDTRDFGRFVNRPFPGIIDPAHFDAAAAVPVLLQWLPRVSNGTVKETMVRHLKVKAADGAIAAALIDEFRRPGSASYKWVVADTLAFTCDQRHFPALTELAADKNHRHGRAPLVAMLWRVKTGDADRVLLDGICDPDVALPAMSALRRRLGNTAARKHIAPLATDPDDRVRHAARQQLRRIDKKLTSNQDK
jgi:hypothetical protein